MPTIPAKRYQDRSHINMDEEFEARYWAKHLGVTVEQLAAAVEKVGNSALSVRKALGVKSID